MKLVRDASPYLSWELLDTPVLELTRVVSADGVPLAVLIDEVPALPRPDAVTVVPA
jgi:hypothetical protein